MGNSISFEKYISALHNASNSKKDYEKLRNLCRQEAAIISEADRLSNDISTSLLNLKHLEDDCRGCFRSIMDLLNNPELKVRNALPDTVSISNFKSELADFNNIAQQIINSGGTDKNFVVRFVEIYRVLIRYFDLLKNNQYSEASLRGTVESDRRYALDKLHNDIEEARRNMRAVIGLSDEDVKEHSLLFAPEASIYHSKSGLKFPETRDKFIKLGTALVEVNDDEKKVFSDVYPEISIQGKNLIAPFTFSTADGEENSNIYIEYDGKCDLGQLKIAVHQIILKFISEFPVGELRLRYADCTGSSIACFNNINVRFNDAISKFSDRITANILADKLCPPSISSTSTIYDFLSDEFEHKKFNSNECLINRAITHGLYVIFGFSHRLNADAMAVFSNNLGYQNEACSYGIHNLVIVSKADIEMAQTSAKKANNRENDSDKAQRFLDVLDAIKKASVCFEYSGKASFKMISDKSGKNVSVRFGDDQFETHKAFDAKCAAAIQSIIPRFEISASAALEKLDGVISDYDYSVGSYCDKDEKIHFTGKENIAVVFADNTFDSWKGQIMSSLTLGYLSKFYPGYMKIYPAAKNSTSNIMNVVNGLEKKSEKNNILYSLVDSASEIDTLGTRTAFLTELVQDTAKILLEKNSDVSPDSESSRYTIENMVSEDNTKNMRLVYAAVSEGEYYHDDASFRNLLRTVELSKNNGDCGVYCTLEITSVNYKKWISSLTELGIFDHIIVARSYKFYDAANNDRKLNLSVLHKNDNIYKSARSLVNSYIDAETISVKYEEIGFQEEAVQDSEIDNMIRIPVGTINGTPTTFDFDCLGSLIGYMIQGATGSGKSSLLYSLILNGAMKYSPRALQFYLLDFKSETGATFSIFRNDTHPLPHIKQLSIKNDSAAAKTIFTGIYEEQNARGVLFQKYNVQDIQAYNNAEIASAKASNRKPEILPRLIIVIDECQRAFEDENQTIRDEDLAKYFYSLTTQCRAFGIHFVVTTQAMSKPLASKIGGQLSGRCSFAMILSEHNSLFPDAALPKIKNLPPKTAILFSTDGGNTCDLMRLAWHNNEIPAYADQVRGRWQDCCDKFVTFELGNEKELLVSKNNLPASEYFEGTADKSSFIRIPIAMDYTKGSVVSVTFAEEENHALLMVGQNSNLAANIVSTMFRGIQSLGDKIGRAILHVNHLNSSTARAVNAAGGRDYITNKTDEVLREIYLEILRREKEIQTAALESPVSFKPWFVVFDNLILEEETPAPQMSPRREETSRFNMAVFNRETESDRHPELPDRKSILKKIAQKGSVVGIYVCIYITSPSAFPVRITFFEKFKHLITFPGQAINDYANGQSGNIDLPMCGSAYKSDDRTKAFSANLAQDAFVCYYLTTASSTSSTGNGIYKIRPYVIDDDK